MKYLQTECLRYTLALYLNYVKVYRCTKSNNIFYFHEHFKTRSLS